MKAKEFREKPDAELEQLLNERKQELLQYRIQNATGVVDNVCAARELRKDIARIKTILNERKRTGQAGSAEETKAS